MSPQEQSKHTQRMYCSHCKVCNHSDDRCIHLLVIKRHQIVKQLKTWGK